MVVPRVIMPGVVVVSMVVSRVIRSDVRRALLVTMCGVESWGARVYWMVVAERYAFEIVRRTTGIFGLAESHVVRCLAFKDEVCRLFCR